MKTISLNTNTLREAAHFVDRRILSRFLIGRKIAGMIKNKVYRYIFLAFWIGKTVVFYWWIL